MAKTMSQIMPNSAKVYLENTGDKRSARALKGISMSGIIESLKGLTDCIETLR